MKKSVKSKYIDEVLTESWKTVITENNIEIVDWDEDMQGFWCKSDDDLYLCGYEDFFDKHIIRSNIRKWGRGIDNKSDLNQKRLASWLCLINGHNLFHNKMKITPNAKLANEGNNLLNYVVDRFEDAQYSLNNSSIPSWLDESTLERFELA